MPREEMRALVGRTDVESFDNPEGELVYPYLSADVYESVFDLGCGCGRVARQLIQQRPPPARYIGVDLHRGMIEWCRQNLAPRAEGFEFHHHDVHNVGLNPTGTARALPLPAPDATVTLFNAVSVFTHMAQDQAEHYLREAARVLRPGGVLHATWFLFDKAGFPMMQDFQNALFINEADPSNAVIFDRGWLRRTAAEAGLTITAVHPPEIRGFHWTIVMTKGAPSAAAVEWPPDEAPSAVRPPPLRPADAHEMTG